jgi:putative oxidoreductase
MVEATLRTHRLHDLVHFGLRITIGVLFIVHSIGKFDTSSKGFFSSVSLSADMAFLIGLLELIWGTLLVAGILSRISSLLAIEMLSVMLYIKKLQSFSGKGGVELDLLAFVILLTAIVLGPRKISLLHVVKKVPRFLQWHIIKTRNSLE